MSQQRQIASCVMDFFVRKSSSPQQNFVAATWRKKSNQTIFAIYCGDKILLQIQRFSQKFFSTHEAICRCDVLPQRVTATSRPTCSHGVICRRNVLLQLVARPVHTEWSVASTCCCNLSLDLYTRSCKSPRLVAATCRPTCTHGEICGHDLLLQHFA